MPNRQRPSTWHHYVPQGYLRNFTTKGGQLHGYNKRTNSKFENAKPRDVAALENFHTDPINRDSQTLEDLLDRRLESPSIRVINSLIARIRLLRAGLKTNAPLVSTSEHVQLAKFAALQQIRTNSTRKTMESIAHKYRTANVTLLDEEIAVHAHLRLMKGHIQDDFTFFGGAVARNRLTFLIPPKGSSFWTSDHPTLVGRGTDDERAFWGGVGLNDERLELYFPLSWDIMAVFVGSHIKQLPLILEMSAEAVHKQNMVTFRAADEIILGCSPINPYF